MSVDAAAKSVPDPALPDFKTTLGHPRPLWMLFMTEFWERFAFYGIRWALVLYIVSQFFEGDSAGRRPPAGPTVPTWRWSTPRRSSAATWPTGCWATNARS